MMRWKTASLAEYSYSKLVWNEAEINKCLNLFCKVQIDEDIMILILPNADSSLQSISTDNMN